jgi:hypothetical protein
MSIGSAASCIFRSRSVDRGVKRGISRMREVNLGVSGATVPADPPGVPGFCPTTKTQKPPRRFMPSVQKPAKLYSTKCRPKRHFWAILGVPPKTVTVVRFHHPRGSPAPAARTHNIARRNVVAPRSCMRSVNIETLLNSQHDALRDRS